MPGYTWNEFEGQKSQGINNTRVNLGVQIFDQGANHWLPGLYVALFEVVPTGRYQEFNRRERQTESTSSGSYQTGANVNFQQLLYLSGNHYLRTRISLQYIYYASLRVSGYNTYGGAANTRGHIKPGNSELLDIAQEFSLNKNWVAVMEFQALKQGSSHFSGYAGTTANGQKAMVGEAEYQIISLAPAIEYNFNANIGVIAGLWFSIHQKNTAPFKTKMLAINAIW